MSYPDFATRLAPSVSLERAGAIYVILTERTPAPLDAELLDRLAEPLTPADWEALAGEPLDRLHLALLEHGVDGSKRLAERDVDVAQRAGVYVGLGHDLVGAREILNPRLGQRLIGTQ